MDFLQPFLEYAITPIRKSKPKVEEFILREELINKNEAPLKVRKKVQFESQPLIQGDYESCKKNSAMGKEKDAISCGGGEKSGFQVKILMTREEAIRLLSKCNDGGILEFKDVANQLVQCPSNRVHLVSTTCRKDE